MIQSAPPTSVSVGVPACFTIAAGGPVFIRGSVRGGTVGIDATYDKVTRTTDICLLVSGNARGYVDLTYVGPDGSVNTILIAVR